MTFLWLLHNLYEISKINREIIYQRIMFNTSLDILYIVLAAVILLVGILLAVAIIYLIMILRDASKATFYMRDTVKKINDFVYKPLMMATSVIEKIGPIIENLQRKGEEAIKETVKSKKRKTRKKK
jgi:uncharacterized protein YoxC